MNGAHKDPRDRQQRPGGVDDTDRSAAMEERRDPPAEPGSHPPIAAAPQLPAAQQAHVDYSEHVAGTGRALGCERCGDVDRDRCDTGERLWRAWNRALDDAYRQLHRGTP